VGDKMDIVIEILKEILKDTGGSIYIVGGYIRDKLIKSKKVLEDLDIVYEGNIVVFVEELRRRGYSIFSLKEGIGIYRTIIDGVIVDVAQMKGNSIEEDLSLRDYTINAIALKLMDNKIIDPFNGRDHIKARLIHELNESSIKSDKVRILRAFRFAFKYGMHFSVSCEEHIKENSYYIKQYPKERIFNEFIKIIQEDSEGIAFEELERYGVLKELIPNVEELKKIGKCKYHIEDAFTHMNLVYRNFKEILKGRLILYGIDIEILNKNIGSIPIKDYIAFAAFCHDIGKVNCYKNTEGKVSFIGHDIVGSKIMSKVCGELGFPKKAEKLITTLVEAHMYPLGLCKNKVRNYKKSFYKFFSKYDEYVPYILVISYCDMQATKTLYDPDNEEQIFKDYIEKLLEEYKLYKHIKENRFLNGREIMELTEAKGEEIRKLLEEIDKKVYYGEITSKEDIIRFLRK
jgi:poly(A) polymerase